MVVKTIRAIGGGADVRGDGAGFVVLESLESARARGVAIQGEVVGTAWRALPARPHGIGRGVDSRAIAAALAEAGVGAEDVGHVYTSASGDAERDEWEEALLDRALAPHQPPRRSLGLAAGRHSGLAARVVATAAAEAGDRLALVHAVARGGNQVAIVVAGPGSRRERSSPRLTTERALA